MSAQCNSSVDFCSIPLIALNFGVRKRLGLYLNPRNAVAADWTALAEAMGFSYLEIKNYEKCENPTLSVLEHWQAKGSEATVGRLLSIVEEAERKDVIADLYSAIGELKHKTENTHFHAYKLQRYTSEAAMCGVLQQLKKV